MRLHDEIGMFFLLLALCLLSLTGCSTIRTMGGLIQEKEKAPMMLTLERPANADPSGGGCCDQDGDWFCHDKDGNAWKSNGECD